MSVKIAWLIIFLLPLMTGCHTDPSENLASTNWELQGMKEKDSWFYTKAEENLYLEFGSDSTFQLYLSRNGCGGTYSVSDIGNIAFSQPNCYDACCDSEFSIKFASLMPEMRSFSFNADQLILEGEVKMIFSEL